MPSPAGAVACIEELAPGSLALDESIRPRAAIRPGAVAYYRRAYARGGDLGPVVVFRDDDGTDRVADGFHRVPAAIAAGVAAIRCEVHRGDRSACLAHALGANLEHRGIRYTTADKRRAIRLALADPILSGWTDRAVAGKCGVSHHTVARIRRGPGGQIAQLNGWDGSRPGTPPRDRPAHDDQPAQGMDAAESRRPSTTQAGQPGRPGTRVGRDGKHYPARPPATTGSLASPGALDPAPGAIAAPDQPEKTPEVT